MASIAKQYYVFVGNMLYEGIKLWTSCLKMHLPFSDRKTSYEQKLLLSKALDQTPSFESKLKG